jgi:uncharacterized protein (TIGR01777 family)
VVSASFVSVIDAPLDEVVAWHRRPGALQRLSPPWVPVRVVEETSSVTSGQAVLRLPGGVRWVATHRPGAQGDTGTSAEFVDELTSLPVRWRHHHRFEAVTPESTRLVDTVDTPVPGALLTQMFRYRHRQLAADLAAQQALTALDARVCTIAVTGSSGLVGSALCAFLTTAGHRVLRLVRHSPVGPDERQWNPDAPDPAALVGADAVVHLAGAPIAGRFSEAHKTQVRASRVGPTRRLAEAMARSTDGPRVFVCASAVGFYGPDRGDEILTEASARGTGFLADLVEEWEAAADPARAAGIRVVHLRTGIVQSARGGMLGLQRVLFGACLGGRLGDGRQWVPWIDLDDETDVIARALLDPGLSGPFNVAGPYPVRNRDYAAVLARVMHRPALLPVPQFGPALLFGTEGARQFVLAGQRAAPERLAALGHRFRHPTVESSLRHQLGHLSDAP